MMSEDYEPEIVKASRELELATTEFVSVVGDQLKPLVDKIAIAFDSAANAMNDFLKVWRKNFPN